MRTNRYSTLGKPATLFAVLAAFTLAAVSATAATFRSTDGSAVDGEIRFTTDGSVFVLTGADVVTRVKRGDLTPESVAAVEAWEASHPHNSGLSTKFDNKPQPVKMKSPERTGDLQSIQGIVMLAVVVDEKGTVSEAFVKDSSDPRFNAPSVEAMRGWEFAPLTQGSQPTRGLMFVPLQY